MENNFKFVSRGREVDNLARLITLKSQVRILPNATKSRKDGSSALFNYVGPGGHRSLAESKQQNRSQDGINDSAGGQMIIKALLIVGLLLFTTTSYAQSDSLYTLRLSTARKLVHDALRSRVLDSIVTVQEQRISVLEYQAGKLSATVTGLTLNHEQQIRLEQGRAEDFRQLSEVWRKEAKKKGKGVKLWKVLTVVGTVAGIYAGSKL